MRWRLALRFLVSVALIGLASGCGDPCEGVECSGHGECVVEQRQASCDCDAGYHAVDLECLSDDPCQDVDCSGHGICVEEQGVASCDCDLTYHADGLACVQDELPALTCEGGWVTNHLAEPTVVEDAGRSTRSQPPLRLRSRTVSAANTELCRAASSGSREPLDDDLLAVVYLAPGADLGEVLLSAGAGHLESMGRGYHLVLLERGLTLDGLCALPGRSTATTLTTEDRIGPKLRHRADDEPVDVVEYLVEGSAGNAEIVEHERGWMTARRARELVAGSRVLSVRERGSALSPVTHVARQSVHTDEVQQIDWATDPPSYGGLTGLGVVVAVVDTGVDPDHPDLHAYGADGEDLGTRVVGDGPWSGDTHGTNVAGVVAGNGVASDGVTVQEVTGTPYLWRGHAPQVPQIASVYSSYDPWNETYLDHGAHVSNHSYTQSDGEYTYSMASFDEVIREGASDGDEQAPPRVCIFAAANNGTTAVYSTLMGHYSILAPGKNPICVGGSNANDDTYSTQASAGPTLDGRLKPDLVAPGYKEYRPPDGVPLEIDEIRLLASASSTEPDLVWSFDTAGDAEGWEIGIALEDAEVSGGSLWATALGSAVGEDEMLVLDLESQLGAPIAAADYDTLEVDLRMEVGGVDGQHQWPWFWVATWDGDGDGAQDGFIYPGYDEDEWDDGWHTHAVTLSDSGSWTGSVHGLGVWPAPYDYRVIMPEIGGGYGRSGGTSLAAPIAAGVVAMMMEQLVADHGVDIDTDPPLPSTFKALLIQTATDLVNDTPLRRDPPNPDTGVGTVYFEGPDFASGYGLLDAQHATGLVAAHGDDTAKWTEQEIDQDQEHQYAIPVVASAGGETLKITLAWDDAPGSTSLAETEPVLVNDLDAVLLDPEGLAHSPWILDPLPIDEKNIWDGVEPIDLEDVIPARRCQSETYWQDDLTADCEDHRNNVEQIAVDDPEEGWYVLHVRGTSVPEGPQRYSLVVSQECE